MKQQIATTHIGGKLGLAISLAIASSIVHAGGFFVTESSGSNQGMAYAGAAAMANDASTIFTNPAGLSRLSGTSWVATGHYIVPTASFTNAGSTESAGLRSIANLAPSAGGALTGANAKSDDGALVPNLYFATAIDDTLTFGVGISAPFGLKTEYNKTWVGRYHATTNELKTININPSLAYRISDSVSVGGGINIQYLKATLENQVDSYGACVSAAAAANGFNLNALTGAQTVTVNGSCAALTGPSVAANDTSIKLEGDDWSWGLNFGILANLTDTTRLGFSWRQGIKQELDGNATFDRSALCTANAFCSAATGNNPISVNVTLPDITSLSIAQEIGDLTLAADMTWFSWDSIGALNIQFENAATRNQTLTLNWDDTRRFSIGAAWKASDKLTLRAGWAYDETPATTAALQSARVPDNDRIWTSIGASYQVSDSLGIDAGYTRVTVEDFAINNSSASSSNHTLTGTYSADVDVFTIQARYSY